jgi:hypothetical protein
MAKSADFFVATDIGRVFYRCKHRGEGCLQPRRTTAGLARAAVLGLRLISTDGDLQEAIRRKLSGSSRETSARTSRRSQKAPADGMKELSEHRRMLLEMRYKEKISMDLFHEEEQRLTLLIGGARSQAAAESEEMTARTELDEHFERVAATLRDLDVDQVWEAATDQERRVLIEELLDRVTVFPDHLEVTVVGAPPLAVAYGEVGLRESENSGVGGGTPTVFLGLQPCPLDRVQGPTSCLCCAHSVDRRASRLRPPSDEVRTAAPPGTCGLSRGGLRSPGVRCRPSATPNRRPSPALGRSSRPPRSRLAAVAPEERSGSYHQVVDGLFVERRRFVLVTTARRLAAALVRRRSNPGEAVKRFVEVGARVIGAMSTDEQDPCARLALERDDHSVLAPQVLDTQPLQGIRPCDPVAERCATAPGKVIEENLVGACRRAPQPCSLRRGQRGLQNLDSHRYGVLVADRTTRPLPRRICARLSARSSRPAKASSASRR